MKTRKLVRDRWAKEEKLVKKKAIIKENLMMTMLSQIACAMLYLQGGASSTGPSFTISSVPCFS